MNFFSCFASIPRAGFDPAQRSSFHTETLDLNKNANNSLIYHMFASVMSSSGEPPGFSSPTKNQQTSLSLFLASLIIFKVFHIFFFINLLTHVSWKLKLKSYVFLIRFAVELGRTLRITICIGKQARKVNDTKFYIQRRLIDADENLKILPSLFVEYWKTFAPWFVDCVFWGWKFLLIMGLCIGWKNCPSKACKCKFAQHKVMLNKQMPEIA